MVGKRAAEADAASAPKFVASIGGAPIIEAAHRQPTPLHRSRLFNWQPSSVAAISACPGGSLLAVAYESGDLELWDMNSTTCIQCITGESIEITSMAWVKDTLDGQWRTFCSHLDGTINEAEWRNGSISNTPLDSAGGVVWSLSSQPVDKVKPGYPHLLAAACDDGSVRLFGVEGGEPGAQLERVLTVLQGRLLSCAWHPSGEALAVGGVNGTIHVLDSTSGNELVRITAGSSTIKQQPLLSHQTGGLQGSGPCVWKLMWLPDGTLVSGDSDGAVQFWDGAFGTLLHRFQRHKADVLALASSYDGSLVFGAGVDPQVALFSLSSPSSDHDDSVISPAANGWSYLDCKRPHLHDVKAMDTVTLHGGRSVLVSGGVDSQLMAYPVSTFLKEHPVRLSRAPQCPASSLALPLPLPLTSSVASKEPNGAPSRPPLLLCAHNDSLDVWMLGVHQPLPSPHKTATASHRSHAVASAQSLEEGMSLDLVDGPRRVVQIKVEGGARITCSAVSPGGEFVSCCTARGPVRLYRLIHPAQSSSELTNVVRIPLAGLTGLKGRGGHFSLRDDGNHSRALALALTHSHLLAAHPDGSISCYQLPTSSSPPSGEDKDEDKEEKEVEASLVAHAPLSSTISDSTATSTAGVRRTSLLTPSTPPNASSTQSSSLWKQYQAPISSLTVSQDGSVLAAAGANGVTLFRIPPSSPSLASTQGSEVGKPQGSEVGKLIRLGKVIRPVHDTPVASLSGRGGGNGGMSFSFDRRMLAVALTSGHVAIYDVSASSHPHPSADEASLIAKPLQWSVDNDASLSRCLEKLPGGNIVGCSFHSHEPRLVVFSPGGFCHFDLRHPIDPTLLDTTSKRRRSRAAPTNPLLHHALGHPGASAAAPATGEKASGAVEGGHGVGQGGSKGRNGRAVLLPDPCVFAAFVPSSSDAVGGQVEGRGEGGSLLVLEKPWEDVARTFAAPLLRRRYG